MDIRGGPARVVVAVDVVVDVVVVNVVVAVDVVVVVGWLPA
jgi:hypothetical protein